MTPKTRVLVIDDDQNLRGAIKRNLELNHACSVLEAGNGRDGLALARERRPDVILLDVLMPGMAGGEVAEALREDQWTSGIPVVFLTGLLGKAEAKARGGQVGGAQYLAKPASIDEIVAALRLALASKAAPAAPLESEL